MIRINPEFLDRMFRAGLQEAPPTAETPAFRIGDQPYMAFDTMVLERLPDGLMRIQYLWNGVKTFGFDCNPGLIGDTVTVVGVEGRAKLTVNF